VVGGSSHAALKRAATLGDGWHGIKVIASLAEQVERYARAGVDQLVVEPVASDLGDFIDQITQFAITVTP